MSTKTFYQDFLFSDMEVTKDGYPKIEFEYCDHVAGYKALKIGHPQNEKVLSIGLTDLMGITQEDRWNSLEEKVSQLEELIVVDDIVLKNSELEEYKDFFIKTYIWRLSKLCQCRVTRRINIE